MVLANPIYNLSYTPKMHTNSLTASTPPPPIITKHRNALGILEAFEVYH